MCMFLYVYVRINQCVFTQSMWCTNFTWYSCPGPVFASIISHSLQCSTWYRRSIWRGWTRKGSKWVVVESISSTSEVVLLLQLMLSICRSLERATSTNTLGKVSVFGSEQALEQRQQGCTCSYTYSGCGSSYTEWILLPLEARSRQKTLLQRRPSIVV